MPLSGSQWHPLGYTYWQSGLEELAIELFACSMPLSDMGTGHKNIPVSDALIDQAYGPQLAQYPASHRAHSCLWHAVAEYRSIPHLFLWNFEIQPTAHPRGQKWIFPSSLRFSHCHWHNSSSPAHLLGLKCANQVCIYLLGQVGRKGLLRGWWTSNQTDLQHLPQLLVSEDQAYMNACMCSHLALFINTVCGPALSWGEGVRVL